jgi:hypothetical protein
MQVINRDLSIAVLRYFVRQRQQEIASGLLKAPRQKRTPAEAAQLRESAGMERLIVIQEAAVFIHKHLPFLHSFHRRPKQRSNGYLIWKHTIGCFKHC